MTRKEAGKLIKKLIQQDKYDEAEPLIRKELKEETYWINRWKNWAKDPQGTPEESKIADLIRFGTHWLWDRLALCYYERKKYKLALRYQSKALEIAPHCPMNLWGQAGTLDILGRSDEAIVIYKRLLRTGMNKILNRKICGAESEADARGMLTDCRYRIAMCYKEKGNKETAIKWLKLNLKLRKRGDLSIYNKKKVQKALNDLQKPSRLRHAA
jgi:tetratricopeptide (TPR) repeat protein